MREILWPAERIQNVTRELKFYDLELQTSYFHLGKTDLQNKFSRLKFGKFGKKVALKVSISEKKIFLNRSL